MIHKIFKSEQKRMILDIVIIVKFYKELRINYISEIRNGCDVWEQVFRCYCIDPLASLDADRWCYK